MSSTKDVGNLGEFIAARFLEKQGFIIVERNFRNKIGEIDIIAKRNGVVHIVEVKSVSRESPGYRPEELVHAKKLHKLRVLAESYLLSHETPDTPIQIDVVAVRVDSEKRRARCAFIEHAEA